MIRNDNNSHIDEISMVGEHFMDLSESTRSHVHQNFLTSVSWLSNMAPLPPDEVLPHLFISLFLI
ncbi:unnamed protein product [Clavelina lepadiformis]|uniref:Uncharacterized protein n=1 Tax=Clavelina lepadiformis TaxID=159417 RepID=A0ABP0FC18_CLALP